MKKFMAVVLAAMLTLACSVSAFAQTDSAATPDEAVESGVVSIELTKLPDKLTYTDMEVEFDIDVDEDETDWDVYYDALLNSTMKIDIDLTGAVVEATYADGTVENAPLSECTATVADPFKFSDIDFGGLDSIESEEDYLEFMDNFLSSIYRSYTVDVEYKGAKTSYNINLEMSDIDVDLNDSDYELVSYTNPDKIYYSEKDLVDIDDYDFVTDTEISLKVIEPDLTGMTVILKNKTTGELFTVGSDDLECDYVIVDDIKGTNQKFTVDAAAFFVVDDETGDSDYAEFSFDIFYNLQDSAIIDDPIKGNGDDKTENPNASTNDTVTKDNTVKNSDNTAVQTGDIIPAALAVALISGAAFAVFCYRRKLVK